MILKNASSVIIVNQELKRRTHFVRIFPNAESCLRRMRALVVEMHENWLEATRYLNIDHLREDKKEARGFWPCDGGWVRTALRYTGLRAAHAQHHQRRLNC